MVTRSAEGRLPYQAEARRHIPRIDSITAGGVSAVRHAALNSH